jgi:2-methylisocitrate lyase-like PEP mutase family enzyme
LNSTPESRIRHLLNSAGSIAIPGAVNALTARLVESAGFEAVYVTGAGIANSFLAVPDIGLLTLSELVAHVRAIGNAVEIPVVVDADTGFGGPTGVWRCVRELGQAGASAVQIEDQIFPKRCGHFAGTRVIDASEMVEKIRAAVDALLPGMAVVARTDARASLGLEEACRRAALYQEAGADVIFVEGPQTLGEIQYIARNVAGPKMLNIVDGGVTPLLAPREVAELGFEIALYANHPLLGSIYGIRETLLALRSGALTGDQSHRLASWTDRQNLVRKPEFDAFEAKYGMAREAPA